MIFFYFNLRENASLLDETAIDFSLKCNKSPNILLRRAGLDAMHELKDNPLNFKAALATFLPCLVCFGWYPDEERSIKYLQAAEKNIPV